ncbi:uncharacterized protein LOC110827695 [Zootermopsis nevadensis]|uniref:Uncharacterized protein n=1 Tax=Zootermopsis nevadensis TaxID=136037 RepID=A0A067RCY6_ZOONE|nr:uncharacterized protein LOC110827695 [Zootermopsis nevadensis]KDR21721.1 hypothetical protein L798_02778 [Zootermopsis nevadensis]
MKMLLVWRSVMVLMALVALGCCHIQNTDSVINIPVGDPHAPHGVWRKQVVWKARWIKEWRQEKVWKPLWKKVWGPVEIQEWVPIPKPPPGWESKHE